MLLSRFFIKSLHPPSDLLASVPLPVNWKMCKTGSPTAGLFETTEPYDSFAWELDRQQRYTAELWILFECCVLIVSHSWVDAELSAVTSRVCFWLGLVLKCESLDYSWWEWCLMQGWREIKRKCVQDKKNHLSIAIWRFLEQNDS